MCKGTASLRGSHHQKAEFAIDATSPQADMVAKKKAHKTDDGFLSKG